VTTLRALVCFLSIMALSGCGSSRGDIVEAALDRTLYPAETKAERLLRFFEVQALLVRLVAESGSSISDRNGIAMANIAATAELDNLVECLQVGAVNVTGKLSFGKVDPGSAVRVDDTYCSFFESRLTSYEESLVSMVRQAARDDPDAKLLATALTGTTPLDFAGVVSIIIQIAGGVIRDEIILHAFTTDALELEYFVWQPYLTGPQEISANCSEQKPPICRDPTVVRPERASIDDLRNALAAARTANLPPTIRVWHFEEVESFMVSACQALNGDAQVVGGQGNNHTNCSANLPFSIPAMRSQ
jgi:hypothetical protein